MTSAPRLQPNVGGGPRCKVTGKRRYSALEQAKTHARAFSRGLISRGDVASNLYAYVCDGCGRWHLTRTKEWDGKPNRIVYTAPSIEIQRWATSKEAS